ncbi:hypothetical protein BX600DRAFT_505993 [Xylariales sp. PMI_506]|nr:hypothetical protein BX600DRAFT_505993 [Xylariales sp. PMI_506]
MADLTREDKMVRSDHSSVVSSPDSADTKPGSRSKASIRVSRACVQCRSKHVKCDATMPACLRCSVEGKPCFYAKSRRGIRDPLKRSLISDKPPVQSSPGNYSQLSNTISVDAGSRYSHDLSSWHPEPKRSPSVGEENVLLNAYFRNFHPTHPVVLPKRYFLDQIDSMPDSMHFLLAVMNFVGSLYLPNSSTEELRESAFVAACGPLPMTAQSVQGLLIMGIVAVGEMKFEYQNGWTNKAISIALEIGMQHKSFADNATSPILAECYRRVYWSLYFLDCARGIRDCKTVISLHDVASDVELPCEEWEYSSGQIPQPMSLAQYDLQNLLGKPEVSSFTYLVDLCRISNNLILPYDGASNEEKAELFERADGLICDWLIKIPQWKLDLVDSDGIADMVIFHAVAFAQQNRLRIRQCASRQSLELRECFPLGPVRGPHRQAQKVKGFGWNATPIDVLAANSVCDLFRRSFPIKNLSPLCVPGLARVALAYLDACVFLGLDTPLMREKLSMVLHILNTHGETWALSQKIAEELREVTKEYLSPVKIGGQPSYIDQWTAAIPAAVSAESNTLATQASFSMYTDFGHQEDWAPYIQDNFINV